MSVVKKMERYGVRRPRMVRREAKRAGLALADALAMLQQETGIPQRNVFGCDWGPGVLFCHLRVTRERVRALIRDGRAQGVGWTQLTFQAFVEAAQTMGGAWKPKYQCREGFRVLAGLIRQFGPFEGHKRYNGSGPAAEAYAATAMVLRHKWHERLH